MEGKTVILSVLIMSLVMAQIQIEAKSCCPTTTARNAYNTCRVRFHPEVCAVISGCRIISGTECPSCCPNENLENSGDAVNEYCNLGCTSSVCGALATQKNSVDASKIVKEAFENCTKACSTLCAKGSNTALDQIA